ncbi:LacI family DNA-binding transcriptional regulator [Alcaligenes parafaecalis]|uniref:LacI family DNA-binding transcriptional regulator n=1 Tax=Alcaligenes parafaecalis TaxID=171260 RepID=A0ABT3VMU0_9BURK|nr:LacI family DNA-binding transcriptional regulator [Alcaligenes parafaecalis]MCX5464442.1 LacI family DNA-binding transcriptional regulator [Alcaligenes parafaecalis]
MVSMKDVAKAAGVSQPAVSYAYSGSSKISPAVREHIFEVAQSLGYPGPNLRAGSLRSGRVGAIGLIVMDQLSYACADPWAMALLQGISSVNELSNVALTLFPMNNQRLIADGGSASNLAVRGLVDGLIISTLPEDHPTVRSIVQQKIPLVVVDSPRLPHAHYVGIDDRSAAKEQVKHLLALGHRRLGIMVERLRPDGHRGLVDQKRFEQSNEMIARERLAGYIDAAQEAGIEFKDLQIVEAGGFDSVSGQGAAETLLLKQDVTGIIASSDVMALACLTVAKKLGIRVPEDISIIGFDDIPEAARQDLTTIRQPLVEKGVCAAKFLIEMLDDPHGSADQPPKCKIFPTRLIVRNSTAAPPHTA